MKPLYLDRTGYSDGLNCPRLRWLTREFDNGDERPRGIQPVKRRHYFEVGTTMHDALEAVLTGEDPNDVRLRLWQFTQNADAIEWGGGENAMPPDLAAREAATFIEAVMWLWRAERMPALLRDYEVVAVERELEFEVGQLEVPIAKWVGRPNPLDPEAALAFDKQPVLWQSRPDVVLRRRADGRLFVLDFKSSGFKQDAAELDNYLQHRILVYAQIAAVEEALGEPCAGYIYEGIYKGRKQFDKRLGFQRAYTPLAWVYASPSDGLTPPKLSHDNWRTGEPRLISGLDGVSVKDYVLALPQEVKDAQWLLTEPIGANPVHVDRWKRATLADEAIWQQRLAADPGDGSSFPQNDDHCMKYRGSPCVMFQACWDEAVRKDPVASGKFEPRSPNHPEGA